MNAKEQLLRILEIQEQALATRRGQKIIDEGPARIEEIEARFRERNAEYVALQERDRELTEDRKARESELVELEQSKKKYMNDLMQVSNQREYAAMLKEIDSVKARISEHEDFVLKDMEELESLQGQIEEFSAHIKEERSKVDEERSRVEEDMERARRSIERARAKRELLERELPADLRNTLHRIEGARQGLFFVKVEDGLCQACYVRVRPQVFQEIRQAAKVHWCSNCKRLLYYAPTLRPDDADGRQDPDASGASGVEAVNGGAV